MQQSTLQFLRKWYLEIAACLLFTYVLVRAFTVGVTWDEAYSYLGFVRTQCVFGTNDMMDANNHWLNTWLVWLFTNFLGNHPIVLRLPALGFAAIFFCYAVKFSKLFSRDSARLAVFCILTLNPYCIEFLSLSRGYGLALSCLMPSLYYFYVWLSDTKLRQYYLALFFAVLSAYANLVFLPVLLVFIGVGVLSLLLNVLKQSAFIPPLSFRQAILPIGASAILTAFLIQNGFNLKKAGALFYGETGNFIQHSFQLSLPAYCYRLHLPESVLWLSTLVAIGALALLFYFGWLAIIKPEKVFNPRILIGSCLVVALVFIAPNMQYWLNGINLPTFRTFLPYWFLLCFAATLIIKQLEYSPLIKWISVGVIIFQLSLFGTAANFKQSLEWQHDADVPEMLDILQSEVSKMKHRKSPIFLGGDIEAYGPVVYYKVYRKLDWLKIPEAKDFINPINDFYFIKAKLIPKLNGLKTDTLAYFPATNSYLLKNLETPITERLVFYDKLTFEKQTHELPGNVKEAKPRTGKYACRNTIQSPYSSGFRYTIDAGFVKPGQGKIVFSGWVNLRSRKRNSIIIISFQNGDEILDYSRTLVTNFVAQKDKWGHFTASAYIPANVKHGNEVLCYIWTLGGIIDCDDMEMQVISTPLPK